MFSQDQLTILLLLAHYIRRSTDYDWRLIHTQYVTTYYATFPRDNKTLPVEPLSEKEVDDFFLMNNLAEGTFSVHNTDVARALFMLPASHEVNQFDAYTLGRIGDLIEIYAPKAMKDIEYRVMAANQKNFKEALDAFCSCILSDVGTVNPYTYGVTNELEPRQSDMSIACDIILDAYLERLLKDIGFTNKRRGDLVTCSYKGLK